jgi:hypothetical protein
MTERKRECERKREREREGLAERALETPKYWELIVKQHNFSNSSHSTPSLSISGKPC